MLGNLVKYIGEIVAIESINANKNVSFTIIDINDNLESVEMTIIQPCDQIEPIPLTEEWLVKFGFNCKYKSCSNLWSICQPLFELSQKEDVDDDGKSVPQEQVFYYDYKIDVKWVHQLMNLYFALTGKELTIKE
jgi:hypothetical protein